jgi:hypothetical protein
LRSVRDFRLDFAQFLEILLGPIVIAWALVYSIAVTFRWIKRGFEALGRER